MKNMIYLILEESRLQYIEYTEAATITKQRSPKYTNEPPPSAALMIKSNYILFFKPLLNLHILLLSSKTRW